MSEQNRKKSSRSIFHVDNPVNVGLGFIGDLILINIFFILTSLLILTIGASMTAADYTLNKLYEDRSTRVAKTYFKAFVDNFFQATFSWIIYAAIISLFVFLGIKALFDYGNLVLMGLCIFAVILAGLGLTFVFGLISRYENTMGKQARNGFLVGISSIGWAFTIWLMWGVPLFFTIYFPEVLKYLGWIWILLGFSGLNYVTVIIYNRVFTKYGKGKENANIYTENDTNGDMKTFIPENVLNIGSSGETKNDGE